MPIDDFSIFTDILPKPEEKKLLNPSTTRVIVYTTAMEEKRPAKFTENTIGGASPFGDDVTENYKQITSTHLYKMSKEGQNKYSVSIGSVMSTQKLPGGFTAPIIDNPTAAETKFTDTYIRSPNSDGRQAVNYFNEGQNYIPLQIRKGKEFPIGPDIEQVYSQVTPNGNNSSGLVVDAINNVLSDNNLQNPNNVYVKDQSDYVEKNEILTVGKLIVQPDLGKHSPRKFPRTNNSNLENEELNAIHIEKLKTFAIQLLMKSSGENFTPDNDKQDISTFAADIYSEIKDRYYSSNSPSPGATRLGLKIPVNRFTQTEILEKINSNFSKPNNKTDIKTETDEKIFSNGNVNSYLAPFDSLDSTVSNVAGALLISIIANVIDNISSNVDSILLIPTQHSYHECVMKGLEIFFDLDIQNILDNSSSSSTSSGFVSSGGSSSSTSSGFVSSGGSSSSSRLGLVRRTKSPPLTTVPPDIRTISRYQQSPEYYNLIMRTIVRLFNKEILSGISNPFISVNVDQVTNQVRRADGENTIQNPDATTLGGLDYNPKIGISSDITNNYKAYLDLKNSKLIGFLNSLANIGDISLYRKTIDPNFSNGGSNKYNVRTYTYEHNINDIINNGDEEEINTYALPYKTFLSEQASKTIGVRHATQAIASNTTPSRFILPETLLQAEARITGNGSEKTSILLNRRNTTQTSRSRLGQEEVAEIEKKLDASYVPFYMHDLRTNEIISFHAFLESLADNYTPRYSETDGYGRIDSVQTYTSTKRDISFDFIIVATNEKDFDDMWYKVNKLTTLLYPQFTQGRALQSTDGNKFIQPFSQLPGSSPMIRLRIGDVIKSNFSGFNLARLFGVGESDTVFQINNAAAASRRADAEENQRRLLQEIELTRDAMLRGLFGVGEAFNITFSFRADIYQANREYWHSITDEIPAKEGLQLITPSGGDEAETSRRQARIFTSLEEQDAIVEVVEAIIDEINPLQNYYKIRFKNPIPGNEIQAADQFYLRLPFFYFINPIDSEVLRVARANAPPQTSSASLDTSSVASEVQSFLDKTQNPIFKSFETTRGKGLAGFITNLSFTWIEENIMWETDVLNSRAPKMCKVRASFTPIHDIAPGIDSNGFNRAPIYPVGTLNNATRFNINDEIDDESDFEIRRRRVTPILTEFE